MPPQRILIAVLLVSLLSGCSAPLLHPPEPTLLPTATSTSTITPAPTLTPTPTATPTPVPSSRVSTGDHALWNGDYDTALQEYQTARDAATDPEVTSAAILGISRVQFLKGQFPAMLDSLRGLVEKYGSTHAAASAYFWMGQAYEAVKRYGDAAVAYEKYLGLHPGLIDAYVQELRGDALASAGDASSAIAAYEAAMQAPHRGENSGLELKIGQVYASTGNYAAAIDRYNHVYTTTTSDYTKADSDLYSGQAYLALGDLTNAADRFRDAVINFPKAYSAYTSLVTLVDNGLPVNEYYRGLVDYYAGQYPAAVGAFMRFITSTPDHDGSALHFKALTMVSMEDYAGAIEAWDELIQNYPSSPYWVDAWDEKAYTLWADFEEYEQAAQLLLDFISQNPQSPQAPAFLYEAGRIYERGDKLDLAASTWERLGTEYSSADQTFRALIFAGVTRYRLQQWNAALTDFQRSGLLATGTTDQAAAALWTGKVYQKLGNTPDAQNSWQQAALRDPTGYYSERAKELLSGREPFSAATTLDLAFDAPKEKTDVENWLRTTFQLPPAIDLSGLGPLASDPSFIRGQELWNLGLYSEARDEFEDLRQALSKDPTNLYRLVNTLADLGVYRSAIMGARQILSLAGMDDAATLTAPAYFNHLRFGAYFKDLVLPAAKEEGFDPLFAFALIRQESLFEGFAQSSAGAVGLMQVVPATAQGIVANLGWPPDFSQEDLTRPAVSIRLGMHYLNQQRNYFDGDLYAALAAYNGGPGNTMAWKELSGSDPDLFLETIRIEETRTYIMRIYEIYTIYRLLYDRTNP